jgi:hypothetical protein
MKIIRTANYTKKAMDPRNRKYPSWADVKEDHKRRVLIIDGIEYPAHYEVCQTCEGRGSYVNPSIDSNGLTQQDMYDMGEDFQEDYHSGAYDQTCGHCNGNRVELVPNDEKGQQALNEIFESESGFQAEQDAERRMGA